MRFAKRLLCVCVILSLPTWASGHEGHQHTAGDPEKLGTVHFPVSCSAEAQAQFQRAVALLHSFWWQEAAKAFTAVTQTDPSCAMSYWGSAMTLLQNPFTWPPAPQVLQEGWAIVEKAKSIKAKTQRERDYIAAIAVFYKDADTVDHRTRVLAYEKAMEQVYLRYPEDQEAAVFYALALDATALPTDKTYANQLQAAGILEKIFVEHPNHPGVAHYLIHSYDYPPIAQRGLTAARRYAQIAPSAPHALHMPSHIFTRQGLWQESIESNRASAAATENPYDKLHAMDYLAYAYLQGAQDLAAKRVFDDMSALGKVNSEHWVTAYALAAIPARYALERHRWAEAASLTLQPNEFPLSRFPQAEAVAIFARALGAARSGDAAAAKKDLARLQVLHDTLIAAKQGYWSEQAEIQSRVVAAWVARAEGKNEEAIQLMRAAVEREDATDKHPVSPGPIVPARELLGEMLLEAQEPLQALQEFEHSMRVEPNRFNGLAGAARAAQRAGNTEKARTYYTQLVSLCDHADDARPELTEARTFLAKR
jgi:tetratricopeptide (TPR) repeat protein